MPGKALPGRWPEDLSDPDWQQPWLASVAAAGQAVKDLSAQSGDWRAAFNLRARALDLRNHCGLALEFVAQSALPPGTAYESHIGSHGQVPTRENLHDFFNGLVWLTFPAIKARLNALQAAQIARCGCTVRGTLRDAGTLFDENAVLLVVDNPEWETLLRDHAWQTLFVARRAEFLHSCETWLFGHALMEKLLSPYKVITAHAWVVVVPRTSSYWHGGVAERLAWLDRAVAAQIDSNLAPSDFTPLPVLGLPDWWPGQDTDFYADASVFRPRRKKKADTR